MPAPVLTAASGNTSRKVVRGTYNDLQWHFNAADTEGDPILYYNVLIWSDRASSTGDLQLSGISQKWYEWVRVNPNQLHQLKYYSGNAGAKNKIYLQAVDKDGTSNTLILDFTQLASTSNKQPTLRPAARPISLASRASQFPRESNSSLSNQFAIGPNVTYSDSEFNPALEYRISKSSSAGLLGIRQRASSTPKARALFSPLRKPITRFLIGTTLRR
jgi:hypothetical protein